MSKDVKDDNLTTGVKSIMDCAILVCESIECEHCPINETDIFDFLSKDSDICCEALAEWIRAKGVSEFNPFAFTKTVKSAREHNSTNIENVSSDNSTNIENMSSDNSDNLGQITPAIVIISDKFFNIFDFVFTLQRKNSSIIRKIHINSENQITICTIFGETFIINKTMYIYNEESKNEEDVFEIKSYNHYYLTDQYNEAPKTLLSFLKDFGYIKSCNCDLKDNRLEFNEFQFIKSIYFYDENQMEFANNHLFDYNPFLIADPYSIMKRTSTTFHYKNTSIQYSCMNSDCTHIDCDNTDCDHCIIKKKDESYIINRELKFEYNKEKKRWEIVTCENMYDVLIDLYFNGNIKIEYYE